MHKAANAQQPTENTGYFGELAAFVQAYPCYTIDSAKLIPFSYIWGHYNKTAREYERELNYIALHATMHKNK
jgi:hypothetical protein